MCRAALLVVTASLATVSFALLAGPVSAASHAPKAPPCAGKTAPAAIKAIKKTWDVILKGTGPATLDQKAASIQGTTDPAFRQVFDSIATQNAAMVKTTTVRVDSVKCTSKTTASVAYTLVLSGTAPPGVAPPGNAVLGLGSWKATKATICDCSRSPTRR